MQRLFPRSLKNRRRFYIYVNKSLRRFTRQQSGSCIVVLKHSEQISLSIKPRGIYSLSLCTATLHHKADEDQEEDEDQHIQVKVGNASTF